MKSAVKCDKHCASTCCSQPVPQISDKNHMAKTHRSITYVSVLVFESISNYIYIFGAFLELTM